MPVYHADCLSWQLHQRQRRDTCVLPHSCMQHPVPGQILMVVTWCWQVCVWSHVRLAFCRGGPGAQVSGASGAHNARDCGGQMGEDGPLGESPECTYPHNLSSLHQTSKGCANCATELVDAEGRVCASRMQSPWVQHVRSGLSGARMFLAAGLLLFCSGHQPAGVYLHAARLCGCHLCPHWGQYLW